jgi:2-polyprenyl-6-methoxyphenol hydroxylase-like FAD-dependent oxidoreductase
MTNNTPPAPRTAVIAGAGIGGLAVAAALHRQGWDVIVHERAAKLEPVGAAIAIAANAMRALDRLGIGDAVRAHATIPGEAVMRRPDGRVLSRTDNAAIAERFGDPIVPVLRSVVLDLLAGLLPEGAIHLDSAAVGVEAGGPDKKAILRTSAGEFEADLVVAADGVNSVLRRALFPEHPGPAYSGFSAWRMLVPAPSEPCVPGETWGRGLVVGILPLADGRVYAYAADRSPAGAERPDHRQALQELFGGWHAPIPELIASATPENLLFNEAYEMSTPLPAFHVGRVAFLGDAAHAMTPHLGQGGCQAIEDAVTLAAVLGDRDAAAVPEALADYTADRLPRTSWIVKSSHRTGAFTQIRSRPGVFARDLGIRVVTRLFPKAMLRSMTALLSWEPPAVRSARAEH